MEALRKQAKKLTETAQQAVLKQFGGVGAGSGSGPSPSDTVIIDEAELERHRELEFLYGATKSAKHFQREVIKGIEGIVNANLRHIETIARLSDECRKYGSDSPGVDTSLGRAALHFGSAHSAIERERDLMDRALGMQVGDPLKQMVTGAELEDARNLTQRYDRLRQEAETLVLEIQKRTQKQREGAGNPENAAKLQIADQKMMELSQAMTVLGKQSASAMTAVSTQQQTQTLQRLIGMVEAEKAFHAASSRILDKLLSEMLSERQKGDTSGRGARGVGGEREGREATRGSTNPFVDGAAEPPPPSYDDLKHSDASFRPQPGGYFLAEVLHSFDAEGPGELSLHAGNYVVVRQVTPNGWSEGESRGKAGWFPTDFVERRERVPARKIVDWVD